MTTTTHAENLLVDQRGHQFLPSGRTSLDATLTSFGAKTFVSIFHGVFNCAMCDTYPGFELNAETLVAKTECPMPDGQIFTFDIEVPSGRIIVTDDLRPVFDLDLPLAPSYNSVAGQAAFSAAMAEIGCAYGPVSNTCPSLVRTGDDTYAIQHVWDESPVSDEDVLAWICTDLWAYSIADFDLWTSRSRQMGLDPDDLLGRTVVDLPAGTYRFTHLTGVRGFEYDQDDAVFATIEKLPVPE